METFSQTDAEKTHVGETEKGTYTISSNTIFAYAQKLWVINFLPLDNSDLCIYLTLHKVI